MCGNSACVTSLERVSGRPGFFFMLQPFSLTWRSGATRQYNQVCFLGRDNKLIIALQ